MCGICGYIGDHRPELLEPMCAAMAHRGPDGMGSWHDPERGVGLGHRRLAIIDLSDAGRQPMTNEDGTIWISYNGESYNFQDHRQRLIARGHKLRSHTDTEVLVHLYEELGPGFLKELNAIFALAIWDQNRGQLLLARDHAGVKPLYYWEDSRRLFFASEIKALLRIPGIPRVLNPRAASEYLTFLWVPGEDTLFKGIKKLEPGHCLTWKDRQVEVRPWFSLAYEPDEAVAEDEWPERVQDALMQTTRRQMVSDVPLGAFLSGGADSSSIVACMRRSYPQREIRCYNVRLDSADNVRDQFVDDYPYAKRVAEVLDVKLLSRVLKPDVMSLLPKLVYHLDEPDADPAVLPSYLIAKWAREDGTTVLLSGTGGDEIFFGYRSHQAYRQYERLRWIPRWLTAPALAVAASVACVAIGAQKPIARRLKKFRRGLSAAGLQRHLAIVDWSSPATRLGIYTREFADSLPRPSAPPDCMTKYFDGFVGSGELNRHSHMLIQTFLSAHNFLYTDKSSMAASVEVRVPFMDVELMKLCAKIPERHKLRGHVTKHVLKKAMEDRLPKDVLYRSKTGFGAPVRKWIVEDLEPMIGDLLAPQRLKWRGLFEPRAVQRILEQNKANRADHAYLIYALLVLELWQQTFIDRAGREVVA